MEQKKETLSKETGKPLSLKDPIYILVPRNEAVWTRPEGDAQLDFKVIIILELLHFLSTAWDVCSTISFPDPVAGKNEVIINISTVA